jgi:hypothetical protein
MNQNPKLPPSFIGTAASNGSLIANVRFAPILLVLLCIATCAADQKPSAGKIVSMQSVSCGSKKENKNTSTSLVCQQYVVHTATTEYAIRQPKPSEQEVLPANTPIEFTLDKDKMKFKVNGKKYQFLVVGTSALPSQ